MGEDSQSSDSHSAKLQGNFFPAPPTHGSLPESSESSVSIIGPAKAFASHTDYDKLYLSLLCGLPNEQELALNVCTILSNEGNYMLHLEQAPKLVNVLLAQTGIWPEDDESLKMLHLESWKGLKGRNMYKFWRSTLDLQNRPLVQLLGLDIGDYDPDSVLFNLEGELGCDNVEGQRVLRVALILHNLSFEKNNVPVLISNRSFMRFMLLCIHSSWSNLKQIAYDTLSNLACAIKLSIEKDICSRLIFQTVMNGILSFDRYMNIRSLDILAQLCSYDDNEDIIPSRLDIEVYQRMVSLLTVSDIMLLFNTLEALYALSDLGRYACDKIVSVHRCIGALVSLLTLEPNDYGPSGQINMKVVKTLVPADADSEKESTVMVTEEATPLSPSPATTAATATPALTPSIPAPIPTICLSEPVDSETFAINWLKSSYELVPGKSITRNEIYSDYLSACTKAGRKDIANANVFTEYIKRLFPLCVIKKTECKSICTFHHEGLARKCSLNQAGTPVVKPIINANTLPRVSTPTTPVSCKPTPKTTFNSILKSQLSSAPRSNATPTPTKSQSQVVINQKIQSSPLSTPVPPRSTTPVATNSGSSTLIKSLLASKVQQRNLQPQVLPQNVSKMVIYSPGTSGLLGSTTVVRCIRPGALHAVNIGSPLRTPLQTCLVSNNGRIIANASPRFVKNATVLRPGMQTQILKQGVTLASTPRINGLQKDVQMEVNEESFKISTDVPSSPVSHLKPEQNHVAKESVIVQHSSVPNGEGLQLIKSNIISNDLNVNCSSVIQENSGLHKVIEAKDLLKPENLLFVNSKVNEISPVKEQKESCVNFENMNSSITNFSFEQSVQSTKALSSPTSILKYVLSDLETQPEQLSKQQQLQKDICKRAPLLNGLLDKGKLPSQVNIQSNTSILNGSEPTTMEVINVKENKPSQFVQLNQNFVIPVSSLNTVISAPQSNLILMPVSSMNSVISSSSLNSGIFAATSMNSTTTYITTSNTTVPLSVPSPVLPSTTFLSNGSNIMQLCIGQTTLSGTAEVQSDQGVVRLHIESPENSNQGSDLSSISDITRTLECASKALLKTNAECNSQVSFSSIPETTPTIVTTTSPSIISRTGQQFFVVTPTINQPQLQIQPSNIKFHILHSVPKIEESVDLISFPNVTISSPNQLQQSLPKASTISTAITTVTTTTPSLKRPSSEISTIQAVLNAKKPCIEPKTSLLADSLRLPTSVPCTFDLTSVSSKPFQDAKSILMTPSQMENAELISKVTSVKTAKPVPKVEVPYEKGARTFSGLSSVNSNQPHASPSSIPPKSAAGLEFICEWKHCGLKFRNPSSVFLHASKAHTPIKGSNDLVCLWDGCDSIKRKRLSLLTHLQDWHCNESVLQTQALRRKQIVNTGKSAIAPPQKPPPHPGYAPDAALLAIKRHGLQYINPKELSEEKESVLTKSIRLTSALILRNLVTHSTLARTYVRRFEPELAYLAMSPIESARTLAQCLSQLYSTHD